MAPVPKDRLIVPAVSMGKVHFGEPRRGVEKSLGAGKRIERGYVSYLQGRLRIVYSYHDAYTGKAEAMITTWPGFRTRSGIHVGSTRDDLNRLGFHVSCFDGECTDNSVNPDFPNTLFMMRHGLVAEIFVGTD
jgi:hypothetical protein